LRATSPAWTWLGTLPGTKKLARQAAAAVINPPFNAPPALPLEPSSLGGIIVRVKLVVGSGQQQQSVGFEDGA
jgi:hypothetical protein